MNDHEFRKKLKGFEGYSDHMYLDSRGYVTIGVGIMLPNVSAAQSAQLGFCYRGTNKPASMLDIKMDYLSVSKAPVGLFPVTKYAQYTKLDANSFALSHELNKRIQRAKQDAKRYYPKFASLPRTVQYALIDMAFNLGLPRLLKYRKMKVALLQQDWQKAASESYRHGVQASRNNAIASWIRQAAQRP